MRASEFSILSEEETDFLKRRAKRVPSNFEIGFSEGYDRGFRAGLAEAVKTKPPIESELS